MDSSDCIFLEANKGGVDWLSSRIVWLENVSQEALFLYYCCPFQGDDSVVFIHCLVLLPLCMWWGRGSAGSLF